MEIADLTNRFKDEDEVSGCGVEKKGRKGGKRKRTNSALFRQKSRHTRDN